MAPNDQVDWSSEPDPPASGSLRHALRLSLSPPLNCIRSIHVRSVFGWLNLVTLYSLQKILYPKRRIYSYSLLGTVVSPDKILPMSAFSCWYSSDLDGSCQDQATAAHLEDELHVAFAASESELCIQTARVTADFSTHLAEYKRQRLVVCSRSPLKAVLNVLTSLSTQRERSGV